MRREDEDRERERERERERGREREREKREWWLTIRDERQARSELAGRPTLNQRHERANLPSTPLRLGDRRSPKRPNPPDGVPRLEGSAVRQSNLGKPQPRQVQGSSSSCSTRHEVEGPQAAPSFPASAQTTVPHVRSHRTRSIQRYHPHCNELAIPDRATAKRTRKTSKLSQLHATNFARICIEVHVQVLRDRVVAKLAKRLSRWRTR